jgi:hypothetical protein
MEGVAHETDSWREPLLISKDEKLVAQNALALGRYNDAVQFLRNKIQMIPAIINIRTMPNS